MTTIHGYILRDLQPDPEDEAIVVATCVSPHVEPMEALISRDEARGLTVGRPVVLEFPTMNRVRVLPL